LRSSRRRSSALAAESSPRTSWDAGGGRDSDADLKHLFDWSYDDLEQEVRANLVYRAFTRIDAGEVPDAKTILKIARALGRRSLRSCTDRCSTSRSVRG
jgi:hypothetical protein